MKAVGFALILLAIYYVEAQECNIPVELQEEIRSYSDVVNQIIEAATNGVYKGRVYDDLADFVDNFSNRMAGTESLEAAIDNLITRMEAAGMVMSVDSVPVAAWTRGEESLFLLSPRPASLTVLGLGGSPGTPTEGVTAEVLVVKDFDELDLVAGDVPGKIVLFNSEFVSYMDNWPYRNYGPYEAAKRGAVGALVRSLTPFSIDSPHTGQTRFKDDVEPIPSACITLEDADLMARLTAAGKSVRVNLKMGASQGEDKLSRNVIGDLVGSELPDEFVSLSGHIDSWDVGQGAMDDGGGVFISWHALALIKELNLPIPRRTLRAIAWTGEEGGVFGATSYLETHRDELDRWSAGFESDIGQFHALGLNFVGNEDATCIMREVVSLFGAINATEIQQPPAAGSDISLFGEIGVPVGEPYMVENKYFWFHHSAGDSMRVLDSKDLDQNMALFAATAYVLGSLSIPLPRGEQTAQEVLDQYLPILI